MKSYLRSAMLSCAAWIAFDAHAVTFTVNDTADLPDDGLQDGICHTASNTCTLRAAVMQANVTGGAGVTIALPAGTFTLLRPVLGGDGDYEGDLNLQSPAMTLSINGAGAGATIIDGNGLFRVFDIAAGASVSIAGITIRNGYTTGKGGGIAAGLSGLSISDCAFDHNTAAWGGALAKTGVGMLSVTNAQFTDNTATVAHGGAIYLYGDASTAHATISHATFSGNSAAGGGGAMASVLATVNVSDSAFTGNHADAAGAGALVIDNSYSGPSSRGQSSAKRITISGNTAAIGAGIVLSNALLTLDASTISGNVATGDGGGIALLSNLAVGWDPATLTVTSSTIAGNMAHGSGGALWANSETVASFASSTVAFNVADSDANQSGDGGGFYVLGNIQLRNALVAANTIGGSGAASDCASTGAALAVYGSNLFTSPASISSCAVTAQPGGNYGYVNDLTTLLPLQDNGGPTQTVGLKQGSNAIDAGDSLAGCVGQDLQALATDQRGEARSVGLRCDIGAFEYGADSVFASSFESAGKLVINEVDYDQVGTDTAEFIEIRNNGPGTASLAGVAVVLVNGADGAEYARIDLSGATQLAAGAYLVVHSANVAVPESAASILFAGNTDQIQNGSPDGIALIRTSPPTLIDALSYEGTITAAQIVGFSAPVSLVEGTPLELADSNTAPGSLARFPDGADGNDANSDWAFRATPTPGAANQ